MGLDEHALADSETTQLTKQQSFELDKTVKKQVLERSFADNCESQQLQILRLRLKFLKQCRTLKRPPSSLRIRGASSIPDSLKCFKFSLLESDFLEIAIKNRLNEIASLSQKIRSEGLTNTPLPKKENQNLKGHFDRKLSFYRKQDLTKWQHWPPKPINNSTSLSKAENKMRKNYKKRINRKRRKTKRDAKKALESKLVIILINKTVPLGAIALLG